MSHLKIFLIALAILVVFSFFLRTQITNDPERIETTSQEIDMVEAERIIEEIDINTPEDTKSTIDIHEKNPDTIVCPDDVYVCSGGGYGTPNYDIELKRVPPTCEFPACPG